MPPLPLAVNPDNAGRLARQVCQSVT